MKHDNSLKNGCVENGDLIFANDFEKIRRLQKSLISRFV